MSAASVSVAGNIDAGNLIITGILVDNTGNLELQSAATNGNVNLRPNGTGIVGVTTTLSVTGNITGGNIAATNHTGTAVSVTGAITGASLTVSTGAVTLGSIVNANANGVGNIGATGGFFNTVFAKATSAQYADLAEWYEADADYEPGTVLIFGGSKEVTQAIRINDVRVAGVVSTNPAHIMNAGLEAKHTAAVALTGRVPTLVVGTVKKGDMMVTAGGGRAQACAEPRMGSVIGKALQDHLSDGQGVIEIVVGRM
jgi:hypothetical protein